MRELPEGLSEVMAKLRTKYQSNKEREMTKVQYADRLENLDRTKYYVPGLKAKAKDTTTKWECPYETTDERYERFMCDKYKYPYETTERYMKPLEPQNDISVGKAMKAALCVLALAVLLSGVIIGIVEVVL